MGPYLPTHYQQASKGYLNLINVLEVAHGLSNGEAITLPSILPFGNAKLLSQTECEPNPTVLEATIRLFFIGWFHGYRDLPGLSTSAQVEKLIQDSETYNLLSTFSELGVRIALVYIYNEVEAGGLPDNRLLRSCAGMGLGFKPSTNLKAMQLLKAYLSSHIIPFTMGSIPPGGVAFLLRNTSWVLPWLWHHREVDEEFVVAIVGFLGQ